jgi:hypothetical protein
VQKIKVVIHMLFVGMFRKYEKKFFFFGLLAIYENKLLIIFYKNITEHSFPYVISGPRGEWQL